MIINCKIEAIDDKGSAKCGVHIERNSPDIPVLTDVYEAIEIASILRALRDCNKMAFNAAMEKFIEEELSNE